MFKIINTFLVSFIVLLACSKLHASDSIKVGVCMALTGEASKWSDAQMSGLMLKKEEYIKEGLNLELVIQDTGTNTMSSVSCFKYLVEVEKVQAVIGNIWDFLTHPLIPMAEKAKIPLISPAIFRHTCPNENSYVFSVAEQIEDMSLNLDNHFFLKFKNIKKISIIAFDDDGWGKSNIDAVTASAKRLNIEVTEIFKTQDLHLKFNSVMPKILRKNPDAIFIYHEPLSSTKSLRSYKYKGAIIQSSAIMEQMHENGNLPDLFNEVLFMDVIKTDSFISKFYHKYKRLPYLDAHSGYDALKVTVDAIRNNPKDPADYIKKSSFDGAIGKIDFTKGSCAGKTTNWGLFKVQNGVPKRVLD